MYKRQIPGDAQCTLINRGALIFPTLTGLPFNPYQPVLYNAETLFADFNSEHPCSYCETLDARVYQHWRDTGGPNPVTISDGLSRRLHDMAMTDAIEDFLKTHAVHGKIVDVTTSNEFSRHYWNRVEYNNASVTELFRATHSAFQGSPTYSTDPGTGSALAVGGAANWVGVGSFNLVRDHPSGWLDGYTDALDVQGSIELDTWFRTEAMSVGVPIEVLDPADYQFNELLADPNPESPNHEVGYSE